MNIFAQVALYSWILVSIILFYNSSPYKAVILSIIGGYLFLPAGEIPGVFLSIIDLDKFVVISLGLILGEIFFGKSDNPVQLSFLDVLMLLWCFVMPTVTSLSNGLGLNDAVKNILNNILHFGTFYWFGRRYLNSIESIMFLYRVIIISGLIYAFLCLYEIRMSPQLSIKFYGFFPHSWIQHVRGGSFRPIVFLDHGLSVTKWMAYCTLLSFAAVLGLDRNLFTISNKIIFLFLFIVTILTKSVSGIIYMFFGLIVLILIIKKKSTVILSFVVFLSLTYFSIRLAGFLDINFLANKLSLVFPPDRMESLMFRLRMEEPMFEVVRQRLLFGWGWVDRGLSAAQFEWFFGVPIFDSYMIILLLTNGLFGYLIFALSYLFFPRRILSIVKEQSSPAINDYSPIIMGFLLIIIIFYLDTFINSSQNPIIYLLLGSVVGNFSSIDYRNMSEDVKYKET